MKMIGIWLVIFLFSLGNSLPPPTPHEVETIHGFAHYQDTETCPDPNDCKTFTHEQQQLMYFEDGTIE
ncbi:MAG: hypothetical protein ACKVTZ_09605 [Bacteroidia bacterium]